MGNPFSWITKSLVPLLIAIFGLVLTGQEREAQDFEMTVDLLSGDCDAKRTGWELANLYLFECENANLLSHLSRTCRFGNEYQPIVKRLRDKAEKDISEQCAQEAAVAAEAAIAALPAAPMEEQAVGAIAQQNSLALIEDIYMPQAKRSAPSAGEVAAEPEPVSEKVQKKYDRYEALVARLNPRVVIHVRDKEDFASAELFRQALSKAQVNGKSIDVPPLEWVSFGPGETELRVLKSDDLAEGKKIAEILQKLGCSDPLRISDLSKEYDYDRRVRRRTYELWFTWNEKQGCLANYAAVSGVNLPDAQYRR